MLLRYNVLVVLLCVTMNRPYQFYSFVPLVSCWYLTVAVTMWLPPRVHRATIDEGSWCAACILVTAQIAACSTLC